MLHGVEDDTPAPSSSPSSMTTRCGSPHASGSHAATRRANGASRSTGASMQAEIANASRQPGAWSDERMRRAARMLRATRSHRNDSRARSPATAVAGVQVSDAVRIPDRRSQPCSIRRAALGRLLAPADDFHSVAPGRNKYDDGERNGYVGTSDARRAPGGAPAGRYTARRA